MNRKGQTLVEFILILPLIIIILFVIVDFGMILSKKSELDNISVDVVSIIKNGKNIDEIEEIYPDIDIEINDDAEYKKIKIEDKVNIITPGLNLLLGDPYVVSVERVVPND